MKLFEVGKLFEEGKTRYNEGCIFDFDNTGGDLYIFFNSPTQKEIIDIKKGNCKIGIVEKNNIIFMLFKFGALEWIDCPYSKYLSKDFAMNSIEEGMGYAINMHLIEANTGILKVLRLVSMTTKFSKKFADLIINQQKIDNYDFALSNVYANYTTNDLVKFAEIMKVG